MGLGEGFTSPQRAIDESFKAFIEGGNDIVNKVALTNAEVQKNIRAEKAFAKEQEALRDNEMSTMYSKVNELGGSSSSSLDANLMSFWEDKADKYFTIKNDMDRGQRWDEETQKLVPYSKQEGMKALAAINGLLPQFKEEAAFLAKEAAAYQEDLANNNVSSIGSIQNKTLLSGLAAGANVGIVEEGGKTYYFVPEHIDQNGNKVESAMINGREMMANAAKGKGLYERKANIDELLETAFNNTYQPSSLQSKYVKTIDAVNGQPIPGQPGEVFKNIPKGQKYTYQIIEDEDKDKGQEDLMTNGSLDPILSNDNIMVRYWQDNVPDEWLKSKGYSDDVIDSRWNDFPPDLSDQEKDDLIKQQNEAAKAYMAEQAYDKNADMDNKLKFMQKQNIVGDGSNSGDDNGFTLTPKSQLTYNTRYNDYKDITEQTESLYANGTPQPEDFVRALKMANPGKDYFVNKNNLIQSGTEIIEIPDEFKEANKLLNSLSGIDREMQILFSKKKDEKTTEEMSIEDYLNE